MNSGTIRLDGKQKAAMDPSDRRKQVRYVTQYMVEIPGTPREFVHKISQFESWKHAKEPISEDGMIETICRSGDWHGMLWIKNGLHFREEKLSG